MLTLRARVRAENSPYLYIGDVQFPLCSNTNLAWRKRWLVVEAIQRELTVGRTKAIATAIDMIPFAPFGAPEARCVSGTVDDACTAAPADVVVVELNVLARWDNPRQVTARQDHLNDFWNLVPRTGRLCATCTGNTVGCCWKGRSVRLVLNRNHTGHPRRCLPIWEETAKRADD